MVAKMKSLFEKLKQTDKARADAVQAASQAEEKERALGEQLQTTAAALSDSQAQHKSALAELDGTRSAHGELQTQLSARSAEVESAQSALADAHSERSAVAAELETAKASLAAAHEASLQQWGVLAQTANRGLELECDDPHMCDHPTNVATNSIVPKSMDKNANAQKPPLWYRKISVICS